MGETNHLLKNKIGDTAKPDVHLYSAPNDFKIAEKTLAVKIGTETLYAGLISDLTDKNASNLRVKIGDKTYAPMIYSDIFFFPADSKNYAYTNGLQFEDIFTNGIGGKPVTANSFDGVVDATQILYRISIPTFGDFNFASATDAGSSLANNSNLKTVGTVNLPVCTNIASMFSDDKTLNKITAINTSDALLNTNSMFDSCEALTTIPAFNTKNVTDMGSMFSYCTALTSVPALDTSNVTKMTSMFNACSTLTTIPNLDTSKVTDMSWMFKDCTALTSVPALDTSKVTGFSQMFKNCTNLKTLNWAIDLSGLRYASSLQDMFYNCGVKTAHFKNLPSNITAADIQQYTYLETVIIDK